MLTVDKLVKTLAYEENRKNETQKKLFSLPIFNHIMNEEEWNKEKQETRRKKEIELNSGKSRLEKKEEEKKELAKKVLEYRAKLQQMSDERTQRHELQSHKGSEQNRITNDANQD